MEAEEAAGGRPSPQSRAARVTRTFYNHKGNNRCQPQADEGRGGAGPSAGLGRQERASGSQHPATDTRAGAIQLEKYPQTWPSECHQ